MRQLYWKCIRDGNDISIDFKVHFLALLKQIEQTFSSRVRFPCIVFDHGLLSVICNLGLDHFHSHICYYVVVIGRYF